MASRFEADQLTAAMSVSSNVHDVSITSHALCDRDQHFSLKPGGTVQDSSAWGQLEFSLLFKQELLAWPSGFRTLLRLPTETILSLRCTTMKALEHQRPNDLIKFVTCYLSALEIILATPSRANSASAHGRWRPSSCSTRMMTTYMPQAGQVPKLPDALFLCASCADEEFCEAMKHIILDHKTAFAQDGDVLAYRG